MLVQIVTLRILAAFRDGFEVERRKVIPLQTWTGAEGSMRFRITDFMTIGT